MKGIRLLLIPNTFSTLFLFHVTTMFFSQIISQPFIFLNFFSKQKSNYLSHHNLPLYSNPPGSISLSHIGFIIFPTRYLLCSSLVMLSASVPSLLPSYLSSLTSHSLSVLVFLQLKTNFKYIATTISHKQQRVI